MLECWRSAFLYFCCCVACEPVGVGVAVMSADWVALASLWEAPTPAKLSHLHLVGFHCLLTSNLRHQYVHRMQQR
jgi:hypothetical protein